MVQGAYDSEDSIDSWTLTPEDHVRIAGKSRDNRLAFAVLLLFFRANGRFPEVAEIHPSIVALVAQQLGVRGRAITDGLVELLIEIIHHIGARAERKVERELLEDLKRVTGKQTLLFELAEVALAHPEGIVREVVFPVVG